MVEGRIAHGAEQHALGRWHAASVAGGQRGESLRQRGAADRTRLDRQLASEAAGDGLEHEPRRADDLWPDAIAGEKND